MLGKITVDTVFVGEVARGDLREKVLLAKMWAAFGEVIAEETVSMLKLDLNGAGQGSCWNKKFLERTTEDPQPGAVALC